MSKCVNVFNNYPPLGEGKISDVQTGISYSYNFVDSYEWDQPILVADLLFLHYLIEGLNYFHIDQLTYKSSNLLPTEMLKWFLHIRCAYRRALASFLIQNYADELVQRPLRPPPQLIPDRLCSISTIIMPSSRPYQGMDCPSCLAPLNQRISESSIRFPCGHILGLQCIKDRVEHWDRGSSLKVCALCDTDFDVTKDADGIEREPLLGSQSSILNQNQDADALKVCIEEWITRSMGSPGMTYGPSPWWMNVLRDRVL
jgi:hypothetical protein